jgi:hypothetical protein
MKLLVQKRMAVQQSSVMKLETVPIYTFLSYFVVWILVAVTRVHATERRRISGGKIIRSVIDTRRIIADAVVH